MHFLLYEASLNVTTFRDVVAWDSFKHGTHYIYRYLFLDIDAVTATFQVLVAETIKKYEIKVLSFSSKI